MDKTPEERLAYEALYAGAYSQAADLFAKLASQGSALAFNALGWMHDTGRIGAIDKAKAVSCYRKAAEGGIAEAYYNLGSVLQETGDDMGARTAFDEGAHLGDLRSMFALGDLLVDRAEDDAEIQEGLQWLERAASYGHLFAQKKLLSIALRKKRMPLRRLIYLWKVSRLAARGFALYRRDRSAREL